MDYKKSLILYLKAIIIFIVIIIISNTFIKSGTDNNKGLAIIGYLTYWGLIFLADTIANKK